MERNRKTSLVYITCAAALLALLGAFFMFLGLSRDFTPSLGYFEKGSLPAILLYATLTVGVGLGAFSWMYFHPHPAGAIQSRGPFLYQSCRCFFNSGAAMVFGRGSSAYQPLPLPLGPGFDCRFVCPFVYCFPCL